MAQTLPADWAVAKRMYFSGEHTLQAIAKACRVTKKALEAHARAMNWPAHDQLQLDGASAERSILRRIIKKKLDRLEKRMDTDETAGATATATDSERQSREFASILSTVDKLDAKEEAWLETLAEAPADPLAAAPAHAQYGDGDVEHWRQELAQRIKKLSARWKQ